MSTSSKHFSLAICHVSFCILPSLSSMEKCVRFGSKTIKDLEVFSCRGPSWPCWHVGLLENQKPKPQVKPAMCCTANITDPHILHSRYQEAEDTSRADHPS